MTFKVVHINGDNNNEVKIEITRNVNGWFNPSH